MFHWLLKAPTRAGRNLLDKIDGFRMFLQAVDGDRLNRLMPPEKTPELFEKDLPYAVARFRAGLGTTVRHSARCGNGHECGVLPSRGTRAPAQWLVHAGIAKTITEGVSKPKQYRSLMPPMGGAQLTPDQISALAAYVWGLSHHASRNRN
jgi:hypothetical protein